MPEGEDSTTTAMATQTEGQPQVEERPALATAEEAVSSESPETQGETKPVTEEADPLADKSEDFRAGAAQIQAAKDREINELKATHDTTLAEAREAADDDRLKSNADHQDAVRNTQQNAIATTRTELVAEGLDKFLTAVEEYDPSRYDETLKSVSRLIQENNGWAQMTSQSKQAQAIQQGEAQGVARGSQLMQEHLPKDVAEELAPFIEKQALRVRAGEVTPNQQWKNVIGHMVELIEKRNEARLENQIADRLTQEQRANGRKEEPQPAAIGGRGASRSINNSDQARLDRLALGRDDQGQAPTEADRAWLAARN